LLQEQLLKHSFLGNDDEAALLLLLLLFKDSLFFVHLHPTKAVLNKSRLQLALGKLSAISSKKKKKKQQDNKRGFKTMK
jgi:hypothetical protein